MTNAAAERRCAASRGPAKSAHRTGLSACPARRGAAHLPLKSASSRMSSRAASDTDGPTATGAAAAASPCCAAAAAFIAAEASAASACSLVERKASTGLPAALAAATAARLSPGVVKSPLRPGPVWVSV